MLCLQLLVYSDDALHVEYPSYDGWYNNLAHPDWGGAGL